MFPWSPKGDAYAAHWIWGSAAAVAPAPAPAAASTHHEHCRGRPQRNLGLAGQPAGSLPSRQASFGTGERPRRGRRPRRRRRQPLREVCVHRNVHGIWCRVRQPYRQRLAMRPSGALEGLVWKHSALAGRRGERRTLHKAGRGAGRLHAVCRCARRSIMTRTRCAISTGRRLLKRAAPCGLNRVEQVAAAPLGWCALPVGRTTLTEMLHQRSASATLNAPSATRKVRLLATSAPTWLTSSALISGVQLGNDAGRPRVKVHACPPGGIGGWRAPGTSDCEHVGRLWWKPDSLECVAGIEAYECITSGT